ncbi:GGDEF domain-containing protein [Deinococcus peraridilitoris]|uniref:GGDEF domain-containing protein n=1 Tax=Deinococcus peraridilitoris TaxID=432329 RepID=UPI0002F4D63F|nr:GGDEF domain-containing protein [Deinococcus peraridilitoris]
MPTLPRLLSPATDRSAARRPSWAWSALLLLTVLHTLWVLAGSRPEELRVLIGNLVFLPIYALAAVLTYRAARAHEGKLRRAWSFISAALLAWGLGQVAYTYLDLTHRAVPFPSVADVGFLLFVPLFLTGVLHLCAPTSSRTQILTFVLDVLIIMLTVAGLVLPWVQRSVFAFDLSFAALAHPTSDLLLVTILVFLLGHPGNPGRTHAGLLGLGVLAFSGAHVGYGYLSAGGTYQVGQIIDPLWNWGAVMFALAAHRSTQPGHAGQTVRGRWGRLAPRALQFLPYVAITVSFARMFLPSPAGSWTPALNGIAMTVAFLVLLRLLVAEFQNARLTRWLRVQAYTDALTGLPNRAALYEQLPVFIARAGAAPRSVGAVHRPRPFQTRQ